MSLVRPVHPIQPGSSLSLHLVPVLTAILFLFGASSARATGINLAWDDCGEAGKDVATFACNTNTGPPFVLYASFVPPDGIDQFVGLSASIRMAATTFPDWWKIGSCRANSALTISIEDGGTCPDPWNTGRSVGAFLFTIGGYGTNTGRILVQAANAEVISLTSVEYTAFRIRISRSKTVGGECGGCSQPLAFTLNEIQLFQPDALGNNPVLTHPLTRNQVYWQGGVGSPPTITSFSPPGGAAGTLVTVHGSSLGGTSIVRFGGKAAIATPVSSSEVRAFVPLAIANGPLTVETPFGSATSAASFVAAPTIDYAIPPSAPVGTRVDLYGRGLTGATQVLFGGVAASFEVMNDSYLFAMVPPGATTGPITVLNPVGSDAHGPFQVGPTRGGVNLSWNECADKGQDLMMFQCDGSESYHHLVGSFVPPSGITSAQWLEGDIAISATNLPDWWKHGTGQCRGTGGLQEYTNLRGREVCDAPAYWTSGGSPQYQVGYYGPNTARLKVSSVFTNGGAVLFPDREYYAFDVLVLGRESPTSNCSGCSDPVRLELRSLTIHQAAALNHDPVITDPVFRNIAYWQGTPGATTTIAGFTPPGGPIGTLVTVQGSGFTGATNVRFGSAEAPFNLVSDSEVLALVPQQAWGEISVLTPRGLGFSSVPFFLPPEVMQVDPPLGMVGDPIAINGANLSGTTGVTFNGVSATFQVESDREITAIVPEGATTGPLAVTNPAGTTVFSENFQVVDDTTPTLVSLARAEALSDRVRLAWDVPRSGAAGVYRREGVGAWIELARLNPGATGRLEYEDLRVKPGATYGYRLGLMLGRHEIFAGDVTIMVPAGISASLELRSVQWEKGRLRASLNLPASGTATLEVFDLSGRRQFERGIERLDPGTHAIEWDAPGMASGIYFARLTHNGSLASRRFFVAQ